MRRKLFTGISAVLIASPAYAHGEDFLNSIYVQAAAVAVTFYFLFSVTSFRRHWLSGVLGCIAGVVISWLTTADMPHTDNHVLITAIDIVSPLLFAALAVTAANRYAAYRRRA